MPLKFVNQTTASFEAITIGEGVISFPTVDGTLNQALVTDGNGRLFFANVSGSGTSGTSGVNGTFFGSSGTSGSGGSSGTRGTAGSGGSSGTSGSGGVNGTNGSGGTTGSAGTSGSGGTSGVDGTSGSGGTSGVAGTNGTAGSGGTSGVDGTNGTAGSGGANGTNGTAGSGGTSGVDGTHGTAGSGGTSGVDGIHGTAGSGGTSGSGGVNGTSGTSGINGDQYNTTSTSSHTLGNSGTITVDTQLAYTPAQTILISHNVSNYQESLVSTYNPSNGELIFGTPTTTVGSGTYTSWSVNLAGASGGDGSSGTAGSGGTSGVNGTNGTAGSGGTNGTAGSGGTSGVNGTAGSGGTSGTSFRWMGVYDNATVYKKSDVVEYNGSVYICILTPSGAGNNPDDVTYWEIMVISGANGTNGTGGTSGVNGTSGSSVTQTSGSFTPDINTSNLDATLTISTANGEYYLMGGVVHVFIYIDALVTALGTGRVRITNLPYNSANNGIGKYYAVIGAAKLIGPAGAADRRLVAYVPDNGNDYIDFRYAGDGNNGFAEVLDATFSDEGDLYLSITYPV